MKIIAISGSPRSGNCERLVKEALEAAQLEGAEVELVLLRKLRITRCCGDDQCYHTERCKINDEISELMKRISECDGMILGSPSYFNNVTGLMKEFMDRTNPYAKYQRWSNKKAAIIVVGGATHRSLVKCAKIIKDFFWIHRINVVTTGYFLAEKPTDASQNQKYLKKAKIIGKKLAKS
ncbi:MAG: flavodoxin family protein [Candidatus Micrarchaeota archaeon]